MKTVHEWEAEGGDSNSAVTSWVSVCPGGLWKVLRRRTQERGVGDQTPKMGSLCKIRVQAKTDRCPDTQTQDSPCGEVTDASAQVVPYPRSQTSVLQVPLNAWAFVRLGEGQCDVVEGCVEGMKAGEKCELLVTAVESDSKPKPGFAQPSGGTGERCPTKDGLAAQGRPHDSPLCFVVELHSFTPGWESWEMTPGGKWAWVKGHRERGGQRFREGDVWGAADCYSRALKLLITLKGEKGGEKHGKKGGEEEGGETKGVIQEKEEGESRQDGGGQDEMEGEQRNRTGVEGASKVTDSVTRSEKTVPENMLKTFPEEECPLSEEEYNTVKAGLHSNLSLCQLRLGQPAKAQRSSSKATELDPTSVKAWYRLGQACSQIGELAMARAALKRVLELQPGSASALKALREVDARERDLDSKLGKRLSKMFT
ncbi:uncharacterized protein fkbpl [Megalops cyprinoides]|uniref:uncharacterized protein fkbpl n=1 Tax=Megalops cyprinoides TaxID=118141 RepID=UPI001864BB36|nr:uncharacterized protein fkbpl [Megalops cyprinoides]